MTLPDMGLIDQSSFLSTLESRAGWLPGNFSIRARTLRILQQAGLSSTILDTLFAKEGGWSKMGNQCFTKVDADGNLENFGILVLSFSL